MTLKAELNPHETELNPHEAVPGGWPPRQVRSRALLAWAVAPARQLVRAESATTPPAIHGVRDAQLATPAEPARAYLACAVSRSMEPIGWATLIEPIRHGDFIAVASGRALMPT